MDQDCNTFTPIRPAVMWVILLILCSIGWSFRLTSFLHAKELVLALALPFIVLVQHRSYCLNTQGFRQLAPLWFGLGTWAVAGLFTAHVYSLYIESLIRWFMILLAASLALSAFDSPQGRTILYRGLLTAGVVVGVLALLQYGNLIPWILPVFPGYEQPAYSVFGNQNLLGGFMAVHLVLTLSLWMYPRKHPSDTLLLTCALPLLLAALIVSRTRSAWLAALFGCVMVLVLLRCRRAHLKHVFTRKSLIAFLLLVVTVAIILVWGQPIVRDRLNTSFSDRDVGGHARLWFWAGAVRMFGDHPWCGVGLGQFGYWSPLYQGKVLWDKNGERFFSNELHTDHAHSEPLEWMAETGFLGTLFWLWFFLKTLKRNNPVLPALLVLIVFSFFNTFSHSTPHMLTLLLLAASSPNKNSPAEKMKCSPVFLWSLAILFCFIYTVFIPSMLVCRAERAMAAGHPCLQQFEVAVAWPWFTPRAHESYATALMDLQDYDAAIVHLHHAKKGLDTGRIYFMLSSAYATKGENTLAVTYAKECLIRWPRNYYAWEVVLQQCPTAYRAPWLDARRRFLGEISE